GRGVKAKKQGAIWRGRAKRLAAFRGGEGGRGENSGTAVKMQRTVAQALRSAVGAVGALELDGDALLLEEAKLRRRDGNEIGWRIEVGDHQSEHADAPGGTRAFLLARRSSPQCAAGNSVCPRATSPAARSPRRTSSRRCPSASAG